MDSVIEKIVKTEDPVSGQVTISVQFSTGEHSSYQNSLFEFATGDNRTLRDAMISLKEVLIEELYLPEVE